MRAYNGLPDPNGISTWFDVVTLNVYSTLSVTVVPTPGNSGAFETILMAAFTKTAEDVLFWVVLTCRSLTYYVYIVVGFGITIFEMIRKAVRRNKEKRLKKLQGAADTDQPTETVEQTE